APRDTPRATRQGLRSRRRRSVLRRLDLSAVRRGEPSLAGAHARDQRDAGRCGARRAEAPVAARFRALAQRAGRTDVAEPLRPWTPGLAPRVFGDVRGVPRSAD